MSFKAKGKEKTKLRSPARIFTRCFSSGSAAAEHESPQAFFFFPLQPSVPQEAELGSKRFSSAGSERERRSITCSRELRCWPYRTRSHPAS